ncbi:MAG: hypothetical protein RQ745_08430 [Longimicrobiales bacterium]|nr:hypothetical protein [Longimicrobiales bacterium]
MRDNRSRSNPGHPGDAERWAPREYAHLLRIHDRTRTHLREIVDELAAPGTQKALKELRRRIGDAPQHGLSAVVSAVEEALRVIQVAESEIQAELNEEHAGAFTIDGIDNLPIRLERFLAERSELPGFSYTVDQDEVRGWVVKWRELTGDGRIRGYGQFYERPYAWLDE